MRVVEVTDPAERSRKGEAVLRGLPDPLGIDERTAACIRDVAALPLGEVHGFQPGNPCPCLAKRL